MIRKLGAVVLVMAPVYWAVAVLLGKDPLWAFMAVLMGTTIAGGLVALLHLAVWLWKSGDRKRGRVERVEFTPIGRAIINANTPEEVRAILNVGRSHPSIREDS